MVEAVPAKRANTQQIEAANRAEVTALLIRSGYRVYRPEADVDGEDLVLAKPTGELIKVQLKGRAQVDLGRYRNLWMLFPSTKFSSKDRRDWFLIEHKLLFDWTKQKHGNAPKWKDHWSYPTISADLGKFLKNYAIKSLDNDDPD